MLHKNLDALGENFKDYLKAQRDLEKIEEKLDRELRSPAGAEKYRPLIGMGLGMATGLLRKVPMVDQVIESDEAAQQVTDTATSALLGLLQEKLSLADRKLYANPTARLAEALGKGLAHLTKKQSLVILLDTYEIVDRPECDYGLRQVIKSAGNNVVWVIAGRANLTKSRPSVNQYVRGYEQDFEENLYPYPLKEFNGRLVAEYFQNAVPERDLPEDGAERIAVFSLGIPFVVQQIAEMWEKVSEIGLDEILDRSALESWDESSHDQVIRVTSERFLKHCFAKNAPDDLRMICCIALLRQPDNELLRAMLQVDDFVGAVDGLKQRHSFILLAGKGIRLHDKLEDFLREALRSESILLNLKIDGEMLRELNEYAVMYLEERLKGLQKNLPISEWYEDERITNGMLNLVHHLFWLEEERGWEYAVPRFVEAWQYDRNWGESLLEGIEVFRGGLCKAGKKRLKVFQQGFDGVGDENTQAILDELEKISRQKDWLGGVGGNERQAILLLKTAQVYKEQKQYLQAIHTCVAAKDKLSEQLDSLKISISKALENIGDQLRWQDEPDYKTAIIAYEYSSELDSQNKGTWFGLGFALGELGRYEEAIASYDKALEIKPDDHEAWKNRGIALDALGRYEEAIASYDKALEIKPDLHEAWNNRGWDLHELGRYEEAITSYDKALEIKPDLHQAWFGRGYTLSALGRKEEAIASYDKALEIKPDKHGALFNKACLYAKQNQVDDAIKFLSQAIDIDPINQEDAKTDSDFDSIRDDPRFQSLINQQ